MTAVVGLFTLRRMRVAIGEIKLNDLQVGEWRELSSDELGKLRK